MIFRLLVQRVSRGISVKRPAFQALGLVISAIVALSAHAETPDSVPGEFIIKYKAASNSASRQARIRSNLGVNSKSNLPLIDAQVVTATRSGGIDHEYVKNLLASGLVEYVEPNYVYHTLATPNDSQYSQLWGMHNTGQTGGTADIDIDAPEAWSIITGGNAVVGVVDTGVDYNHPDVDQSRGDRWEQHRR